MDLCCHVAGRLLVRALLHEHGGKLCRLPTAVRQDLLTFDVDLCQRELRLAGDRCVFASGHRKGTSGEAGKSSKDDRFRVIGGRSSDDAHDQRKVGDKPVHRTEHRRS